jgi:hypothetical protein
MSIHRDPRWPKGVWYCHFTRGDGVRATRSTGTKDKTRAKIICECWQAAEREAAGFDLTRDRVSRILNETLERLGQAPVERLSVEQWLSQWLGGKTEVSTATRIAYEQAAREFLAFLWAEGLQARFGLD